MILLKTEFRDSSKPSRFLSMLLSENRECKGTLFYLSISPCENKNPAGDPWGFLLPGRYEWG
jgi:hypothetical protein